MKRLNKLIETKAIVSQIQRRLAADVGNNPLRLRAADMDRIVDLAKEAYDSLENLHCEIEDLISESMGLTEKQKWVNAAKSTGGAE